ncbi:MAG: hypothetical protein LBE32_00290 [Burkholderiales bacterium]|jgi:hypothetical protein|nr:hypothetical protein [Burkholderiales bacterium]
MKRSLFHILGSAVLALGFSVAAPVWAQGVGTPWTQTSYTAADVAEVSSRRIFFAHNSVGNNVLRGGQGTGGGGVEDIASTIPLRSGTQPNTPGITDVYTSSTGHGANGDPRAKIAGFVTLMNNGGHQAQIAFLKLCYIDFESWGGATSVGTVEGAEALFAHYQTTLNTLQQTYPNVTFVHVTSPLYIRGSSYAPATAARHHFNQRMRQTYGSRVFDLAAIESIDRNGNPVFSLDNVSPALAGDWSADGSHLNDVGSARVAGALISFLAQVSLTPGHQPGPPSPPEQFNPTRQYTGQWIKANPENENAWGLTVLQNFGNARYIFVPWYTYDSSGRASWYIFQGPAEGYGEWTANDTFEASVYRYTGSPWGSTPYDNNRINDSIVGTAKLTFTSATTARFEYNVEGSSRTIDLRKLD